MLQESMCELKAHTADIETGCPANKLDVWLCAPRTSGMLALMQENGAAVHGAMLPPSVQMLIKARLYQGSTSVTSVAESEILKFPNPNLCNLITIIQDNSQITYSSTTGLACVFRCLCKTKMIRYHTWITWREQTKTRQCTQYLP